jgi:hypothetical protein
MRSFAANGFGVGLSYTRPWGRRSQDGAPLVTVPITDAGTEPIILARTRRQSPHARGRAIAALIAGTFAGPQTRQADGDS